MVINETDRLVVHADDVRPQEEENRVVLFRHDGRWDCLPAQNWQYSHFYTLCGDFAVRAESGTLTVNGARMLPEKYLALWRRAFQAARPVSTVAGLAMAWDLRLAASDVVRDVDGECDSDAFTDGAQFMQAEDATHRRWRVPFGPAANGTLVRRLAGLGCLGCLGRQSSAGSHLRLVVLTPPASQLSSSETHVSLQQSPLWEAA